MKTKKFKKKFKRKDLRLKNIVIDDLESFSETEIVEEKRAEKKILEKAKTSKKSGLKLKKGRILKVKTNYRCLVAFDDYEIECPLSGRLKQLNLETRSLVATGDFVMVDFSEEPRIEEILPRKTKLTRFSEAGFQTEVIIAANIDQVIITVSVAEPPLNLSLVDRYICAAALENIIPIICINKIDLADNLEEIEKQVAFYSRCGYKVVLTSVKTEKGLDELKKVLKNKQSVFSGHSGVGKSSLINKLQPGINLRTGEISEFNKKGIHVTTSSRLIPWKFGGFLVDTPGIKTFGLPRKEKDKIPRIFPGFSELSENCKFQNCSHTHENECAVKDALARNEYPQERYFSYLRIWESL
ncbi:MAG: ribosome small subunit-dependent GTPase A [Candidatus Cloacimonadota bacterium]|nr:MAG: ribosome small subunit-dependent GTPase A [Candidatus Cloacimonadota bacterium]